jgi:hypothetical protein
MVKRLILTVLLITLTASGEGRLTSVSDPHPDRAIGDEASRLELSLISQKRIYQRGDEFRLQVMLRNPSEKDVYVFGTLDWGYSASLMFHIRNSKGKEIVPKEVPDTPPVAPPADKGAYIRLRPDHFFGTSYFAPLKVMNLTKPGKYSIIVEYRCPFARADVPVSPFWGYEEGTVRSNVVYVEVK